MLGTFLEVIIYLTSVCSEQQSNLPNLQGNSKVWVSKMTGQNYYCLSKSPVYSSQERWTVWQSKIAQTSQDKMISYLWLNWLNYCKAVRSYAMKHKLALSCSYKSYVLFNVAKYENSRKKCLILIISPSKFVFPWTRFESGITEGKHVVNSTQTKNPVSNTKPLQMLLCQTFCNSKLDLKFSR